MCFSYNSTFSLFLTWFTSVIVSLCSFLPKKKKKAQEAAFSAWERNKKCCLPITHF